MADVIQARLLSVAATRILVTLNNQAGALQPSVPILPPSTAGIAGFKLWKSTMSVASAPMSRVPDPYGSSISDVFQTEGIGPLPPPLPEVYVLSPEEELDAQDQRELIELLAAIQEWKSASLIKREICQVSPIRGGEVDLGKGLAEIDYFDQAESVPGLLAKPSIAAVEVSDVHSETPEEDRAFAKFLLEQSLTRYTLREEKCHSRDSGRYSFWTQGRE